MGVILREAGAGAERLLEHRSGQPFGKGGERRPRLLVCGAGARDDRRRSGSVEKGGELGDRCLVGGPRAQDSAGGGVLALVVGLLEPVVHRDDDERRAARGCGLVPGAVDRARHVLRPHRLLGPHRVLAREPLQAPGEEGLEDEVTAVLLPDDDHDRSTVDPRRRDPADGIPEAGRRVHERQRRLAAAERPAGREPEHRALVEREHEAQVVRQPGEKGHLGRAGIREDRRQPAAAEDLEGGVADRAAHEPQTSSATSTISASFAHCSSSLSALPSTVDEKPHCGERQSCSIGA